MKKLLLLSITFLALSTMKSNAQDCIQFELAGQNLSQNLPQINADGTQLIFGYSIVTKIAKIEKGFEQVDNSTFTIPIENFNPLTVNEVAADSAAAFVLRTYPNIK